MMRIVIDLQGAQNNSRHRGIGRYSLALAKAIARNRGDHEVYIVLNALFTETIDDIRHTFSTLLPEHHILIFQAPGPVNELAPENHWRLNAAELIREKFLIDLEPDLVLICSLIEGAEDNTVGSIRQLYSRTPTAAILYDLIPYLNPEKYIGWGPAKSWYYRKINALRRANLLLAISDSARREAIDNLGIDPGRVVNISSAVDDFFVKAELPSKQRSALLTKYGIKRKFIMHSSAFDERKNFEGLIRAFGELPHKVRKRHQLVLVCKIGESGRQSLNNIAFEAGLGKGDLVLTGFVPDDELIALYSECHLFVFPSFHEGFGLPALEAMSCGAAVIGSNNSSIPEVIGREDALFDPTSTKNIACVMERALIDNDFWQSLREHAMTQARKFSWDRCAQTAIAGFEQMHREHPQDTSASARADDLNNLIEYISGAARGTHTSDKDIADVAFCLEANETTVARTRAHADFCGVKKWRIEGPFDSTYSLALVNREEARALEELGHFVVLHSTEGPGDFPPNPEFLNRNPDLAAMNGRVASYPQEAVDVVGRDLYPPRVNDMHGRYNILHNYAWEESGFPQEWVNNFNQSLNGMLCCSTHVEKVMIDNGVSIPIATTSIGTDHWERIKTANPYTLNAKKFRFLHVSSCFPRKGAELMLDAYGNAFTSNDNVSLIIKTFQNPHNEIHTWLAQRQEANPQYPHVTIIEGDISDSELKALYQQCHVLIAPSRAEGFGLPLAEAMLSGLPVITTAWSGQLDFCNGENSWLVDFQYERARTHFDLFSSVWAKIDVDELGRTLRHVYAQPPEILKKKALAGRKLLLESHKWSDVAGRAIHWVQQWQSNKIAEPELRIGWLSTWNTKCGIATYSEHLISHMPDTVFVLAPRQGGQIDASDAGCVRCWNADKEDSDLQSAADYINRQSLNTVVIQFNYGFYNFSDLGDFIDLQVNDGRSVIVMMHSTSDPFGDLPNWRLAELVPAFLRCQRLLVHSIPDLNRLKSIGLIDNVALFPHGIVKCPQRELVAAGTENPLIASYGFCLPHKGLAETIEAVALLRQQGRPVRLRLVNAEYPQPVSAQLIKELKALVERLDLGGLVEFNTAFLQDHESMALLQEADLIVFSYQQTGESASGAVRYGLASGRPVAVTPLSIFDDVGGAAFHLPGTSPQLIAQGIDRTLNELSSNSGTAQQVAAFARRWIDAHDYQAIGLRLHNICLALARKRQPRRHFLHGSSPLLRTIVGRLDGECIMTSGTAGNLIHGPYLALSAGSYEVNIFGTIGRQSPAGAYLDVVAFSNTEALAKAELFQTDNAGRIGSVTVTLKHRCAGVEVRVWVEAFSVVSVSAIEITPTIRLVEEPLAATMAKTHTPPTVAPSAGKTATHKSSIRSFLLNKLKRVQ